MWSDVNLYTCACVSAISLIKFPRSSGFSFSTRVFTSAIRSSSRLSLSRARSSFRSFSISCRGCAVLRKGGEKNGRAERDSGTIPSHLVDRKARSSLSSITIRSSRSRTLLLSLLREFRRFAASIPPTRSATTIDVAFDPRSISRSAKRKREGSLAATETERETSRNEQTIYIDNINRGLPASILAHTQLSHFRSHSRNVFLSFFFPPFSFPFFLSFFPCLSPRSSSRLISPVSPI